jgi:hypothetical protein
MEDCRAPPLELPEMCIAFAALWATNMPADGLRSSEKIDSTSLLTYDPANAYDSPL